MERTFEVQRNILTSAIQAAAFKDYERVRDYLNEEYYTDVIQDIIQELNKLGYFIEPNVVPTEFRKTATKVNIDGKHYEIISTIEILPSVE